MEEQVVNCPKCTSGMERRGFVRYACYVCGELWTIMQEGVISDKRLNELQLENGVLSTVD